MKSKSIHESRMMLSILLVSSSFFLLLLSGTAASKIEPTGTNAGVVRFDAIIELNHYSSRSSRHTHMLIFIRYWVAPDYYSAAVIWAEPQSTDLNFAVFPPTLSVTSDKQGFNIHHELFSNYNEMYKKPLGERGVFRYKFGSYPISNIRFAEQEALATRIYAADLRGLKDADRDAGEVLDVSIPATEDRRTRDVAKLKVHTSSGHIDSMQFFNAKQQLLKSVIYEYDDKGGKTRLRRQTVVLPERPLMVGFRGKGLKVTLGGKEYQYRDLQATHHLGGRSCTVEYEPVPLGGKEVRLPVRVTVCSGQDKRILRSVRMMNFKQVELDAAGAKQAARHFGGFTGEQRKYREFRSRYRQKDPTEVEKADVEVIRQLRANFEKAANVMDISAGEQLKHLNILMELDRILGDERQLERHYQLCLSTLGENKLFQMTLVSGYGAIQTSMFRGRCAEADRLLSRWVDAVLVINDAQSILLFARRQLQKKRFWTTAKLLEKFSAKWHFLADARFEAEVLRCAALHALVKLLHNPDAMKGRFSKTQADWVASSISTDNLERMLADSMGEAKRSFGGIPEATESQQALKKQLDKLDKEINQAKSQ